MNANISIMTKSFRLRIDIFIINFLFDYSIHTELCNFALECGKNHEIGEGSKLFVFYGIRFD